MPFPGMCHKSNQMIVAHQFEPIYFICRRSFFFLILFSISQVSQVLLKLALFQVIESNFSLQDNQHILLALPSSLPSSCLFSLHLPPQIHHPPHLKLIHLNQHALLHNAISNLLFLNCSFLIFATMP